MVDLRAIKQAAREVTDEQGTRFVQIPLAMWEFLLNQLESAYPTDEISQREKIFTVLKELRENPDDTPKGWWHEFDEFLKANPVNFPERDIELGNE